MPAPLILHIDDRPDLPAGVAKALAKDGYELRHMADPEEAMSLVGESSPALVLMEIELTGCEGPDLMAGICDPSLGSVPVLVMTTVPRDSALHGEAIALGVVDFLTKPVSGAELLATIHEIAPPPGWTAPRVAPAAGELSGDLSETPMPELLARLRRRGANGLLEVGHGGMRVGVQLRNGSPVGVSPNRRESSAEAALYETFRWEEGRFTFSQGGRLAPEATLELRGDPAGLLLAAVLDASPAHQVRERLAKRESLYISITDESESALEAEGVRFTRAQRKLLDSLGGEDTLAVVLDSDAFEERLVYALWVAGWFELQTVPTLTLTELLGDVVEDEPEIEAPARRRDEHQRELEELQRAPAREEHEREQLVRTREEREREHDVLAPALDERAGELEELTKTRAERAREVEALARVREQREQEVEELARTREELARARAQRTQELERLAREREERTQEPEDTAPTLPGPQPVEPTSIRPEPAPEPAAPVETQPAPKRIDPTPAEPEPSHGKIAPFVAPAQRGDAGTITGALRALVKRVLAGDDFQALGIAPTASDPEVRAAYEAVLREIPEIEPTASNLVQTQQAKRIRGRVEAAYANLRSEDKRRAYSLLREEEEQDSKAKPSAERAVEGERWFRKGKAHLERKRCEGAVEAFGMATHLDPEQGEYASHLGYALFLSNPNDEVVQREAMEHVAAGIKRSPKHELSYLYLGRILKAKGDIDVAKKIFEKALRIKPGFHPAAQELRVMKMRERNRKGVLSRLIGR